MSEWLLAFDAGCGSCSDVIDRIGAVVSDRLTVVGLGEERVRTLRRQALGDNPPFAPTLLKVDGDRVRAWTGLGLSMRLARLLGPSRSLAVVRALNRADVIVHGGRRRFLTAVPAVAFGAFVVSGGLAGPAMAAPGRRMTAAEAREWAAGLRPLPTGYREVTALPMVQRRAVYDRLPPRVRADLWLEHLRRYRLAREQPTATEWALFDRTARAVPVIVGASAGAATTLLDELREAAVATLGRHEAVAAFGTLGPAEAASGRIPYTCDCNPDLTPCSSCGNSVPCDPTPSGCGWFYQQPCVGGCGG
ncbi:bacteriocin fulvocin C-related protein [Plantactinospora sp. CA-290183]|uniref:bacteriocin fulvocin C-related protein n=1 Tax=Plantactinospora sp. CA-290183 TaxID=3240006 RepID=UPI003D8E036D